MAANIDLIIENLCRFYDFSGRTVVSVGAGGGQFVDFGRRAGKIIAVDEDAEALEELRTRVDREGLSASFEFVRSSFSDTARQGDVVLFEFCLHEVPDPLQSLQHAHSLAPDIVVLDHWPGSEWLYYVVEEDKVRRSTQAMKQFGIRSQAVFQAEQLFDSHQELLAKVSGQGPEAVERARRFASATNILIPMTYAMTLL